MMYTQKLDERVNEFRVQTTIWIINVHSSNETFERQIQLLRFITSLVPRRTFKNVIIIIRTAKRLDLWCESRCYTVCNRYIATVDLSPSKECCFANSNWRTEICECFGERFSSRGEGQYGPEAELAELSRRGQEESLQHSTRVINRWHGGQRSNGGDREGKGWGGDDEGTRRIYTRVIQFHGRNINNTRPWCE